MADYYLFHNQQQVGPLTREGVLRMLQSGGVGESALAWRAGLDTWRPVGEVVDLRSSITPGRRGDWRSGPTASRPRTPISWIPALIFHSVAVGFLCLAGLAELSGDDRLFQMVALMSLPFFAAALAFWAVLHFQCWKILQPQHAATTAGRAIGFLFIPVFNFYWAFISWPKLAEGYNQLQIERWGSIHFNVWPAALANAVCFVATLALFVLLPEAWVLDLLLSFGGLAAFILFYRQVVQLANSA